ncbi:hypothetical protein EJ576_29415 [Pseudomonas sp. C 49-2]|uniref:hypothetical protein n=1 Tax=Pseudomonas TaxID=286 RepID=UPI000F83D8AC|nr:hypothetical protein [Pseudomonas sp. C 49-2]RTX92575.1 hypothetical protein EJ576_29415 [Pseudomonas sp. C 49-2]
MTVAALLFGETFPIAITDNLISSNHVPEASPTTPLTGQEARPAADGSTYPAGMASKVWESPLDVHMLYAGAVGHAQLIFTKVQQAAEYDDSYSLKRHKNIVQDAINDGLAASFIVVDLREGHIHHAGHPDWQTECRNGSFGKALVIGSGRHALLQVMNRLSTEQIAKTLPCFECELEKHVCTAVANALLIIANASVEYMSPHSEFARQSTGGLFTLSFFPGLYGWTQDDLPPAYLNNRLCQMFTQRDGDTLYLKRLILTLKPIGSEFLEVIVFDGSLALNIDSCTLTLKFKDLSLSRIAAVRNDSTVEPMTCLTEALDVYQTITYGQFPSTSKAEPLTHKSVVFDSRRPVLTLMNDPVTADAICITFNQPLFANIWPQLKRA